MDKETFPEIAPETDLELLRTRKELAELKAKVERYELILKENDLLDSVPTTSDAELICTSQLAKYQRTTAAGGVLTLEDMKIVDLLVKNLLLARGKTVPAEDGRKKKNKKEEQKDYAKLLQLAGQKLEE